MKIGSIVKVKTDILGTEKKYVGRHVRVVDTEQRCEGEYVKAILMPKEEKDSPVEILFFPAGELE